MNLSDVKAVIFDMDGLLVDSERLAHQALIDTAKVFQIEPDTEIFKGMIGLAEDVSIELLRRRYGRGFPAELFVAEVAIAVDVQVESGMLKLKPGAAELIDWLERSKIPKAIATSASRDKALRTLTATRTVDRFEVVVTRTEVPRGKPYPDLFTRAALELAFPATNCIALEDSLNGVRAAHAAGMRVVMVPDLIPPTVEMIKLSEGIITDLFDVLDRFRKAELIK